MKKTELTPREVERRMLVLEKQRIIAEIRVLRFIRWLRKLAHNARERDK